METDFGLGYVIVGFWRADMTLLLFYFFSAQRSSSTLPLTGEAALPPNPCEVGCVRPAWARTNGVKVPYV